MADITATARLTTLALATLAAWPAAAQPSGAGPARAGTSSNVDELIVTATRLERSLSDVPAAASVVTVDDIQTGRQQLALDEALARVPGLFMQNRYNFAQDLRISLRGFGARAQFGIRGVKVLVDGIPETLPDGQGSVDSIDLGTTSHIEVLRGPSSSLYGNASGGVISVVTERGAEEPFAEVRLSGGKYDFQKVQLKAGGGTDRVGYLVSVSDSTFDGFREHSRAENEQITGRFDIDLGQERELLAVVNYTDQPVSDDPGGITAALAAANPAAAWPANVQFNAGEALEQTRVGFVYSMPLGERHEITARNYYAWRDFGNLLPTLAGGIVDLDRQFVGGGFQYSYDGFWLDRPNRLIVGIDYDDQDDDRRRYDNLQGARGPLTFDQNERVKSRGIFLQNELSVSRNVELSFGLRFDQVEFDVTDRFLADGFDDSGTIEFEDTSPMVGLVVDLTDNLSLYTTYSTAFETPTTTELNKPDLTGGFNPDLEPQLAENFEVGIRGRAGERNRYELTVFRIDVEDELVPYEVPGNLGRNYFVNAAESERKGFEFSFVSRPTDNLQATVSYTYSDFTFSNFVDADGNVFSGNVIPGTSENVFFTELSYSHPRGWYAAGDVIYIDEQFGDNANTVRVDDYTLASVRFGYDFDIGNLRVSPFIGVNNLFDETYTANVRLNAFGGRFYEPGPGRNGYAGVTLNYRF
ncbi:MAG TPA: TonB-dependent receptor [Gammaproteobacteria bacterium]